MQSNYSSCQTQVLIAALNEKQGIGPTISEFSRTLKTRCLVVDGNSADGTAEVAKKLGAEVIFQDGLGKGDAIMKGIKHLNPETKYVVFTDADYTYPVDSVPKMLRILEDNSEVGMVCGNRFSDMVDDGAFYGSFSVGNRLLSFVHKLFNGVLLADPLTGLRVVRADVLRKWNVMSKGFDVEVELNREIKKQNFVTVEVPIRYRARVGKKKLKMKDGLFIFKRILYEFVYAVLQH